MILKDLKAVNSHQTSMFNLTIVCDFIMHMLHCQDIVYLINNAFLKVFAHSHWQFIEGPNEADTGGVKSSSSEQIPHLSLAFSLLWHW